MRWAHLHAGGAFAAIALRSTKSCTRCAIHGHAITCAHAIMVHHDIDDELINQVGLLCVVVCFTSTLQVIILTVAGAAAAPAHQVSLRAELGGGREQRTVECLGVPCRGAVAAASLLNHEVCHVACSQSHMLFYSHAGFCPRISSI